MRAIACLFLISMKKRETIFSFLLGASIVLGASACKKETVDEEKPTIDLSYSETFPFSCDTIYFGESFEFKALFTDNVELGGSKSYSIDMHHNFDQHSHSTEFESCNLDEKKDAENPYVLIQDFDIPEGLSEYQASETVTIPADLDGVLYDQGDYHFSISLADKEGWSTQTGVSIKILYRSE